MKSKPTNTQELTARYLAAGAGFMPKEQFFSLLNAASHLFMKVKPGNAFGLMMAYLRQFKECITDTKTMEPLADDKAPF